MSNPGMIRGHIAQGPISQHELVTFGSSDEFVARATEASKAFGVCGQPGNSVLGDHVDVIESGVAEVKFGGAVSAGDALKSDANGQAVAASAGDSVVGFALQDAVAGDIGLMHVAPVMALPPA